MYIFLIMAVLGCALAIAMFFRNKKRENDPKNIEYMKNTEEALLEQLEDETVCGKCQSTASSALFVTDKNLYVHKKGAFTKVAFEDIKKIKGVDHASNKTKNPDNCFVLYVYTKDGKKQGYYSNYSNKFGAFVREFCDRSGYSLQ